MIYALIYAIPLCVTIICVYNLINLKRSANEPENEHETASLDESQASNFQETIVSAEGTYFLFKTNSEKQYVDFLESLDRELYEIVNITNFSSAYYYGDIFIITYKKKAQ